MSWMVLGPGFLLGTLAVGLPIVLHFLRRQPTEVNMFPTLTFLVKSLRRKARFINIQRWLVLLARCAILGLLALAFARPFFARHFASSSTALMVVLDNSYSMGAGGQFGKSKAAAIEAVRRLGPGDRAGLVLANSHSRLAVALGQDKEAVVRAIEASPLSFAANDYEGALRMADAQLATSSCGTELLDVFGDDQDLAWQTVDFKRPLSPGVQLNVAPSAARNIPDVAIEEVKITPLFSVANQKMNAEVKIRNFSDTAAQQRTLHLELDGKEMATSKVSLRPGENISLTVGFTAGPLQAGRGAVRLDADAFPVNDTRYFALNPTTPLQVGLWPPGPEGEVDLLSVALAPAADLATLHPAPIASVADVGKCDVIVLRPGAASDPGIDAAIVDAIQKGKPAVLFADGSHASELWLENLGLSSVPRHSSDDPLHLGAIDFSRPEVALFAKPGNGDLFDIRFNNPPDLQLPGSAGVIASFEDGTPAILKTSSGKGALLVVATGLDRASTTWPLESTFLPFVQESLKQMIAQDVPVEQVLVGEPLPGDHPGVNSDAPGLVPTTQNGAPKLVAVNIDPAESDLTTWTDELDWQHLDSAKSGRPTVTALATIQGEETEQHQRYWRYAILAAIGFLFLEIFFANRTPL